MRLSLLALACGVALTAPVAQGQAQVAMDASGMGLVIVGYDSRTCDSSIEGAIRYNSSVNTVQVCKALPSSPPTGCPSIGDLCSDGSIFAGDTNLYVTDVNQSSAMQWKASTGNNDIDPDSNSDGIANVQNITVPISDLPAIELCNNLELHGRDDWFLPAIDELTQLYDNRTSIDTSASGAFGSGQFISSSEWSASGVFVFLFFDGYSTVLDKDNNYHVRCVRRESGAGSYDFVNWGE